MHHNVFLFFIAAAESTVLIITNTMNGWPTERNMQSMHLVIAIPTALNNHDNNTTHNADGFNIAYTLLKRIDHDVKNDK